MKKNIAIILAFSSLLSCEEQNTPPPCERVYSQPIYREDGGSAEAGFFVRNFYEYRPSIVGTWSTYIYNQCDVQNCFLFICQECSEKVINRDEQLYYVFLDNGEFEMYQWISSGNGKFERPVDGYTWSFAPDEFQNGPTTRVWINDSSGELWYSGYWNMDSSSPASVGFQNISGPGTRYFNGGATKWTCET